MADSKQSIFPETRWTTVERAGSSDPATAYAGIESLCRDYHASITAWFRYSTPWAGEAEDLAQSFIQDLFVEAGRIVEVDPKIGKFRSFLVSRMRNHAIDQKRFDSAQRRGGGKMATDLDSTLLPPINGHADEFFDLALVRAAHDRAMEAVRAKLKTAEQRKRFEVLGPRLVLAEVDRQIGDAAVELGLAPGTARKSLFEFRLLYLQAFTGEIRRLVGPSDTSEDLDYLVGLHARAVEAGVLAAPAAAFRP